MFNEQLEADVIRLLTEVGGVNWITFTLIIMTTALISRLLGLQHNKGWAGHIGAGHIGKVPFNFRAECRLIASFMASLLWLLPIMMLMPDAQETLTTDSAILCFLGIVKAMFWIAVILLVNNRLTKRSSDS